MSNFVIYTGDSRDLIKTLPSSSVQLVVTSPAYWKQRTYGLPFEFGDEPTPEAFTDALVKFFREVRRVLREDGLAFVNLGTTYIGGNAPPCGEGPARWKEGDAVPNAWLFGLAARADGWYLRSEIIWKKLNAKPSSVESRPALVHETIVMLSKSPQYFYDADAIREPYAASTLERRKYGDKTGDVGTRHGKHQPRGPARPFAEDGGLPRPKHVLPDSRAKRVGRRDRSPSHYGPNIVGRLKKSVWEIRAASNDDGHTASYPPELVEPAILFGTSRAGACRACGAALSRMIEKGDPIVDVQRASGGNAKGEYRGRARVDYHAKKAERPGDVKSRTLASMVERVTVGWARRCDCDPTFGTIPCTVLDPFGGTHTTGNVATDLGCFYLGFDGNSDGNARAVVRLAIAERTRRKIG